MSFVLTRYGTMQIFDTGDVISRSLAIYGEWAMDELKLLAQVITPGMCVLDVGGFVGTHALAFSKFTGQEGKVYSFEPRKEIYAILSENLSINDCQNVTALNVGLAEKEQSLNLRSVDTNQSINFGALSLDSNDGSLTSDTYRIQVSTIDALGIEKIDLIKLDVEGMERNVLDGAIESISRNRPVVFCECNSLNAGNDVLEYCRALKYDAYGFLASAYNPDNFNAVDENIFGDAKELALILIPRENVANYLGKIVDVDLLPINNLEDLVLPLLHKPQYAHEVLVHTATYSALGLDFPSPAVSEKNRQIASLTQAIAERDRRIADLAQAVTKSKLS